MTSLTDARLAGSLLVCILYNRVLTRRALAVQYIKQITASLPEPFALLLDRQHLQATSQSNAARLEQTDPER